MKVSYPFFNADKIKTPTLFMGGEKDFNVPIAGGEQMYQALKSLGVDTQLVIYPGPVPRPDDSELRARSPAALPELVQQVPAAERPRRPLQVGMSERSKRLLCAATAGVLTLALSMGPRNLPTCARAPRSPTTKRPAPTPTSTRVDRRPGGDQPARPRRELRQDRRRPRPAADRDLRSEGDDAGGGARAGTAAGVRAGQHPRRRSRRQGSDR